MQTPFLIEVGSGSFEDYLRSLGKSARKNYTYTTKHNVDLSFSRVDFRPEQVAQFMELWERQLVEGKPPRWGFGIEFVRMLHRKGHLLCFAAYPAGAPEEPVALQFVEQHGEYVFCHPPMYDKDTHEDRYLAKYMWFRLIDYALQDPKIRWLDLGGGHRGTWRDLVQRRARSQKLSYKWQYVPKVVKENPDAQKPFVVRNSWLSYSKRLVECDTSQPRQGRPLARKYVAWVWLHQGRRKQRFVELLRRATATSSRLVRFQGKRSAQIRRRVWMWPLDKLSYRMYFRLLAPKTDAACVTGLVDGQRVLVVSPHQDDETLGCGGFLIACRGRNPVKPVFVTSGKGPAWLRSDEERERLAAKRQQEARLACRRLGTEEPSFLGIDEADPERDAKLTRRLTGAISEFRPTVVMAPFFADANREHLWVTRCLAGVPEDLWDSVMVMLYRTHAQMPAGFQNVCFALDDRVHEEKESILRLYQTQKLDVDITRTKYLLYTELHAPVPHASPRSIERFCCLSFPGFVDIQRQVADDVWTRKIRSINYAPFSFVLFVRNEILLRLSPLCRMVPRAVYSKREVCDTGVFSTT